MNRAMLIVLGVLAFALGGCGGVSAVRVEGKAIEGSVSFIAAVPANDPRLIGPGIEGVKVEIVSKVGNTQNSVVGSATSGKDGAFNVRLGDPNAVKASAEFRAAATGYLPSTNTLLIPPPDMRVLVILKRSGAGSGGGRPGLSEGPETGVAVVANRSE